MRRRRTTAATDGSPGIHDNLPTPPPSPPPTQSTAQTPSELTLGKDFDRVVENIFDDFGDADAVYSRLLKELSLEGRASAADYGTLVDALDNAEENARLAMQLFVNAKQARVDFEIDARVIEGDLRTSATDRLQKEKADGVRSKQITEGDVQGMIASMFPDEYRDLEQRRSRAKLSVDYLEQLAERWRERAKDLRQMVARAREM